MFECAERWQMYRKLSRSSTPVPSLFLIGLALGGCAAETRHTIPAAMLKRIDPVEVESFFLAPQNDVIEPVPFGGWFVSSRFILRLADLYDSVDAFSLFSPEYCSLIWIDAAAPRMVHASKLVQHDLRTGNSSVSCPALGGLDLTVGQSHSHQVPGGLSLDDTLLANVYKGKDGKYAHVQFVVMYSDGDNLLAGDNPETGERVAVPQQNFLFTKVKETVQVHMWVPLEPPPGLRSLVQVYMPDDGDGWRKVTRCWVTDAAYASRTKLKNSVPPAECDDGSIWQE
jgi:hypothetical protein